MEPPEHRREGPPVFVPTEEDPLLPPPATPPGPVRTPGRGSKVVVSFVVMLEEAPHPRPSDEESWGGVAGRWWIGLRTIYNSETM